MWRISLQQPFNGAFRWLIVRHNGVGIERSSADLIRVAGVSCLSAVVFFKTSSRHPKTTLCTTMYFYIIITCAHMRNVHIWCVRNCSCRARRSHVGPSCQSANCVRLRDPCARLRISVIRRVCVCLVSCRGVSCRVHQTQTHTYTHAAIDADITCVNNSLARAHALAQNVTNFINAGCCCC